MSRFLSANPISEAQNKLTILYRALQYYGHTKWNARNEAVDPWRVIWVDPAEIQDCTIPSFDVETESGMVVGGGWDKKVVVKAEDRVRYPFEDLLFYRSLKEHFVNEVDWENTELFQTVIEQSDFEQARRYGSAHEFRQRCEVIDELYRQIANEGYRSQRELIIQDESDPGGYGSTPLWRLPAIRRYRELDEVAVNIARDGELLFNLRGHHRLSIAKILNVSSIPVRVVVRHQEWQSLRQEVNMFIRDSPNPKIGTQRYLLKKNCESHLAKHPDIVSLYR